MGSHRPQLHHFFQITFLSLYSQTPQQYCSCCSTILLIRLSDGVRIMRYQPRISAQISLHLKSVSLTTLWRHLCESCVPYYINLPPRCHYQYLSPYHDLAPFWSCRYCSTSSSLHTEALCLHRFKCSPPTPCQCHLSLRGDSVVGFSRWTQIFRLHFPCSASNFNYLQPLLFIGSNSIFDAH